LKPPYSFSKILIIQTAFIGDVILATGVIEKLSSFYPQAQLDFLVRKGNEGLLTGHPKIHKLLVWDKKKNKVKNLLSLIGEVREEKYDLVVNLQRFFASGLITSLSKGKMTVGYDKNPLSIFFTFKGKHIIGDKSVHEVDRNQQLIAKFTDSITAKPKLYPSTSDFQNTLQYKSESYICVAPASVWFTKQYPEDKWVELLMALPETKNIYLLGSPQDKELCMRIAEKAKNKNITDLSGKLSLLQSAALIKDAEMNYVNDSAPMHIASAMNAPVCAVYCSTIPEFGFGPLSDRSFVVETETLLACRPCGLHGYKSCPEGHFRCAHEINVLQLLKILQK
jgi:lipopolysaccharide heptosyltransferase II